jgi:FkbM family methyltransferase
MPLNPEPSLATRLRRWLAGRTRRLGWLRLLARWQARQHWLPYDLRFRIARWVNLLTLDAGLPATVNYQDQRADLRFQLDLRDAVPWLTFYFGVYQPHVLNAALALIAPETCCLELGAHIGLHTLPIARQYAVWGQARSVIAFEPSPTAYALLSMHVSQNQLDSVILHYPLAVSDKDADAVLFVSKGSNSANSSLHDLRSEPTSTQDGTYTMIKTVQLRTFWQQPPTYKAIGLIKADIEGAELLAFRGAATLIQAQRPALLFEAHPAWMYHFGYSFEDIMDFCTLLDYKVYVLDEHAPRTVPANRDDLTQAVDCLALPAERATDLLAKVHHRRWRR